ncbi:MAG: hypothetical protein DYG99_12220 [Bacteroidetes bacterium CHB5]|nr:hypothetical protein [Bacteroidetes bacterium CHB5]
MAKNFHAQLYRYIDTQGSAYAKASAARNVVRLPAVGRHGPESQPAAGRRGLERLFSITANYITCLPAGRLCGWLCGLNP